MNLYGKAKITSVMRAGQLRWLRHVVRAEDSGIVTVSTRMKSTIRSKPTKRSFESFSEGMKKKTVHGNLKMLARGKTA